MSKLRRSVLLPILLLGLSPACAKSPGKTGVTGSTPSAASSAMQPPDVVAKVNGQPITESEVLREVSARARMGERNNGQPKDALENLIREELAYQKAVSLKLDADPGYQNQVRRLEAELHAVKRKALADIFYRNELLKNVEIPEDEIKAYFDQNQAKLKSELHVWQMLVRNQTQANALADRLKKGEAFETVAKTQYPDMPATDRKPWDLGFLGFNQIPDPWRPVVYDLKPGQTSGVIAGPSDRYWILELVERRDKADFSYEKSKPMIVALLKANKTEALRAQINDDLRKGANVEYFTPRPGMPRDDDSMPGRPPMPGMRPPMPRPPVPGAPASPPAPPSPPRPPAVPQPTP